MNPAIDKTVEVEELVCRGLNRIRKVEYDAGGKGINVSKTIRSLGGKTLVLGVLGGATGGYIKSALDALDIDNDMVLTGENTRTNIKIVDPALGTNTDINEPGMPISQANMQAVWNKLTDKVQPGDTVVFAGKNPPGMADDQLARWIAELKKLDVRVCVDTVGLPMTLALEQGPDIIKPNREELSELVGRKLITDQEILKVGKELVAGGIGLAAVSMGSGGAIFITRDQVIRGYSPKVVVASTVGAGDAFCSTFVAGIVRGMSLRDAAVLGQAQAAHIISTLGANAGATDIHTLVEYAKDFGYDIDIKE